MARMMCAGCGRTLAAADRALAGIVARSLCPACSRPAYRRALRAWAAPGVSG